MVVLAAMSLPLLESKPTKMFATVNLFGTDSWVYWANISEQSLWLVTYRYLLFFCVFPGYPVFLNGRLNAETVEEMRSYCFAL